MAVQRRFDSIAETFGREFLLRASYLKIDNEKVNDLLDTTAVDVELHEYTNAVQVLKCKEEIASSRDVIKFIIKRKTTKTRTGETNMNERSSRSHTISRLTIASRNLSSDSDGAIQISQLKSVDLAGLERARQTNATDGRFKEGTHIMNMLLSTLGLVIKQLSESLDGGKYANFGDIKLTRLINRMLINLTLQQCIEGQNNSKKDYESDKAARELEMSNQMKALADGIIVAGQSTFLVELSETWDSYFNMLPSIVWCC